MQGQRLPNIESRIKIDGVDNLYQYKINEKPYTIRFIPHPSSKKFSRKELYADYQKVSKYLK